MERRLAAILAADVVGYSRMMEVDEVGTLSRLNARRGEVIDPAIAAHGGRIVKTTGDGVLAEFPSAVEAVACAINVQKTLASRNDGVPDEQQIVFRIGINIGDVIIKDGDIFGDGVNVAARLEGLCAPGGLVISLPVQTEVRDRLPVSFEDLGEHTVKNIVRPVHVFGLTTAAINRVPDIAPGTRAAPPTRRRLPIAVGLVVAITVAYAGAWLLLRQPSEQAPPQPAATTSPAPDATETGRASIAVLPFAALTDEAGGEYFADGLTEDIIAALGRFRDLSVISRGGVFDYKGKNPKPEAVGRDLKVRYVVEGSVRHSAERIRVSVGLTDTQRGALLWSETFDAVPKDIFSVQDRITRSIAGSLMTQVTSLELERSKVKPPASLEAYDLVLRGRDLLTRVTRADNAQARTLFERAIALDPGYAAAHVGLGVVDVTSMAQGWTANPREAVKRAESHARKALELDERSPAAHALLGRVATYLGEYDRALEELQRAIALNGSDAEAYAGLLAVRLWNGDLEGAISAGDLLVQFKPVLSSVESFHLATAHLLSGHNADAIRVLEQAQDRNGINVFGNIVLAAAYAGTGRDKDAADQVEIVRKRFPAFSREGFGSLLRDKALREKLSAALEKAGL